MLKMRKVRKSTSVRRLVKQINWAA